MALVTLVRIDADSGILLADEEFWRRGTRRTHSLDNLQPLLPADFSERSGLEAVIGIEGDPSITYEATILAQREIREMISEPSHSDENCFTSLQAIGECAVTEIERLLRRRIDDQLTFMYGFTTDDFNRGYFEINGDRIDIRQDIVRKDSLKFSSFEQGVPRLKTLNEVNAIIAGYDKEKGFHWYEWSSDSGSLWTGTGNFECIGKGADAANLSLIDFFRRRQLTDRRRGMAFAETAFAILQSYEAAIRFNHEVGGYPNMILIDGKAASHAERFIEFTGHAAMLAYEITKSCVHGFLPHDKALQFLTMVLQEKKEWKLVEEEFFSASGSERALEHFLRGFRTIVEPPTDEVSQ